MALMGGLLGFRGGLGIVASATTEPPASVDDAATDVATRSLIDEIVSRIRALVGDALGDGGTDATCKVFSDYVPAVDFPYVVCYETYEHYSYMTKGAGSIPYLAIGQLTVDVFADDRAEARTLGNAVATALNDCEASLSADEGPVMEIRVTAASFKPYADIGPDGASTVFLRALTVHYEQQRMM